MAQVIKIQFYLLSLLCLIAEITPANAQSSTDSIKFNYPAIFSSALDGNISMVLKTIDVDSNKLSLRDRKMKNAFDTRFKFDSDKSIYPQKSSAIDDLLLIYKNYWRKSLLDNASNFDAALRENVNIFLAKNYAPAKNLAASDIEDSTSRYLKMYVNSLHLHTTGFGKTGKLYDLLVWETEKDTTYSFKVAGETIKAPVVFMEDFITLGWEQYATLGRLHPGGWATKESLFCVKSAYDLSSETFLISYLAHEGRHFNDYLLFPKLESPDLEYRAKLVELGMAQTTLYTLIEFFIINANQTSENDHSFANYCVIRDLSGILFKKEFESDISKWKALPKEKINKAALKALDTNTKLLKKEGKDVSRFIK